MFTRYKWEFDCSIVVIHTCYIVKVVFQLLIRYQKRYCKSSSTFLRRGCLGKRFWTFFTFWHTPYRFPRLFSSTFFDFCSFVLFTVISFGFFIKIVSLKNNNNNNLGRSSYHWLLDPLCFLFSFSFEFFSQSSHWYCDSNRSLAQFLSQNLYLKR